MLVLSRRPQQSLLIGHDVVVTVLEVNGDTVRIGITAPPEVDIHREEVYLDLKKSNVDAATSRGAAAALTRRMRGKPKPSVPASPAGASTPSPDASDTSSTPGNSSDARPARPTPQGPTSPR